LKEAADMSVLYISCDLLAKLAQEIAGLGIFKGQQFLAGQKTSGS
jgi:hypothetical protein